jgi:hypothetical protein
VVLQRADAGFADHAVSISIPRRSIVCGGAGRGAMGSRRLDALGADGFATSVSGLHICLRCRPARRTKRGGSVSDRGVDRRAGIEACDARTRRARRGRRVYVDCLQNALGKTLASAYAPARAITPACQRRSRGRSRKRRQARGLHHRDDARAAAKVGVWKVPHATGSISRGSRTKRNGAGCGVVCAWFLIHLDI